MSSRGQFGRSATGMDRMSSIDARLRDLQLRLPRLHVDLVIVQRVQRRGGGRGDPGGVRAGLRMGDLRLQHVGHQVGHRPHALADLRVAGQAAQEPDVDVGILVGLDPGRGLHVALADHRAGLHRGVDLVAGAVEEAGVDEEDAVLRGADRFLQVQRRAPLLVHDAHLQREARQPERLLDAPEQLVRRRRPPPARASSA